MAALNGVLVADFSRVLAGPLTTMTLADLGATVVKVERPDGGDDTRSWGPPWTESASSYYECANRSKYSVTLDLGNPDDRQLAHELARRADVLVENFRPGGMRRFGLDYEAVAAENPRVVYCSISGFGSDGGVDRSGYDFLAQAVGGLMSITGDPDCEPHKVGVALVDVLTGKDAVIGILAALAVRQQTGRGQHLEVDLLSSLLAAMVNQLAGYLATGVAPTKMGNKHPSIAPYETLHCADGLLALACGNDAQFGRLADVLGRPELAADPRFATNPQRVAHRDELIAELEERLVTAPAMEWEQRLTAARVPAGLVGDIGSAVERAVQLGLRPLVDVGETHLRQVRHPARYSGPTTAPTAPPPRLGEHNGNIRSWLAQPAMTALRHPATPPNREHSADTKR